MSLYPHQDAGADWLAGQTRVALWDEQGLGKTITAIVAADRARITRLLIVCPSCVLWNWKHEVEEWSPWRTVQVLDTGRSVIEGRPHAVVVTHSLLLRAEIREQLLAVAWDGIILDEAHFFRTPDRLRTACFWGANGEPGLASSARHVWAMTGTPMPNYVDNLWTTLHGLAPERFPESYKRFRSHYCRFKPGRYGPKVVGNRDIVGLRERMKGLFLRRKKNVIDLPPLRFEQVTLRPTRLPSDLSVLEDELAPRIREAVAQADTVEDGWARFKSAMYGELEDSDGKKIAPEQVARYRRLCGIAKADAVTDLLDMELENGGLENVVVFAHHKEVIGRLVSRLSGYSTRIITGASTAAQRASAVRDFQHGDARVMICNLLAGGVGTTLTAASDVVFVEMSYVPGENAQAADRIHRIGQNKPCRVRFVALAGTVDEDVVKVLRRKVRGIREVIG